MVSAVLLNIFVALAVGAGSVGAGSVQRFALTKADVLARAQASVTVTCPAPAHHPGRFPALGVLPPTTGGRRW